MINISSIIGFAIFGVIIFSIINMLRRNNEQRARIIAIKEGMEERVVLTDEIMLKGLHSDMIFFVIFIGIFLMVFSGFVFNFGSFETFSIVALIPVLFFAIFFVGIPSKGIIDNIKYKNAIKSGNYYVEEDIVSNKYTRRSDDNTHYYLEFQGQPKKIKITRMEYHTTEIGDKYYIIIAGKTRKAFNATVYQLQDESKITKRI